MASMTRENKIYHRVFPIFWFLVALIWHPRVIGRENIPKDGAFIAYANHTRNSDPVLMIYALGRRHKIHIIGKESLFKIPALGAFLKTIGTISLDRNKRDLQAVKSSMAYLKNGEKLGIFPEGTRVREGEEVAAKSGFVRMAERNAVPLVPMFFQNKMIFFQRPTVLIGKPIYVNPDREKIPASEYDAIAATMMQKAAELHQ